MKEIIVVKKQPVKWYKIPWIFFWWMCGVCNQIATTEHIIKKTVMLIVLLYLVMTVVSLATGLHAEMQKTVWDLIMEGRF